jgi:hypothetical protein
MIAAQPNNDEFDRWRDEISSAFVPVDTVPNCRGGNHPRPGALTAAALGSLQISEVTASAFDVYRGVRSIGLADGRDQGSGWTAASFGQGCRVVLNEGGAQKMTTTIRHRFAEEMLRSAT